MQKFRTLSILAFKHCLIKCQRSSRCICKCSHNKIIKSLSVDGTNCFISPKANLNKFQREDLKTPTAEESYK